MMVATLKEKLRHARKKIPGSLLDRGLASDERGVIGGLVTAGVIIAVFVAVLGMMGAFEWIMRMIAEGLGLGRLLIHIPPFDPASSSYVAIPTGGVETQGVFYTSKVMSDLYSLFVTVSFAVLAVAFVVIGLSYALEGFNVLPPNTASKLLSESVFVLILIFIFPWLFNAGAMALNTLNEGMIMHAGNVDYQEMAASVASEAGHFPALIGEVDIGPLSVGDPTKALTALVCATATFMALLIALATGVFKVLATGAFAAAFPLILALRLIPVTRNVANRITSGVIGLMLTSVIIALFFRFGWEILGQMNPSSVMHWAVAVAILMTAAGAMTIATPVLSGMSAEISGTLGRSTAGAIGGYVAMGTTAVLGGAAGGTMAGGRILAAKAAGGGAASAMGAGAAARTVGRAALGGLVAGAPGRDVVKSMGAGVGAGRAAADKAMAEAIPLRADIEKTQGNITQQMDHVLKEDAPKLSSRHRQAAAEGGEAIARRGIDNLTDERVADAYGRNLVKMGEMKSYNPKHDRKPLMERVSPREMKEALKGSLTDVKDNPRYGNEGMNVALHGWLNDFEGLNKKGE